LISNFALRPASSSTGSTNPKEKIMHKLMTAISFAALALIGINAGVAQTNVQTADVKYDFPTNAQEDDVNLREMADVKYDFPTNDQEDDVNLRRIADVKYDFPTNAQEDDVNLRDVADIRYDFPADEIDGDDPVLKQFADVRYDQRSAPTGGDDDPSMRLFTGSNA